MFDNIGTAIVQAIGFFGVFGFFVYQLLSDGNKTKKAPLKSLRKKVNEPKEKNDKPKKKGLFGKKIESKIDEVKPVKKGLFGRKTLPVKVVEKSRKKGLFR